MPELPEVETVRRGLISALDLLGVDQVLLKSDGDALRWHSGLPQLQGWHFVRKTLRYPLPINKFRELQGMRLLSLERRSKYLLLYFCREAQGVSLEEIELGSFGDLTQDIGVWGPKFGLCRVVIHLGMSGVLRMLSGFRDPKELPNLAKHDHLWLHLCVNGQKECQNFYLLYNDVRRFGFWDFQDWAQISEDGGTWRANFKNLSPEPIGWEQYRLEAPLTLALQQYLGRPSSNGSVVALPESGLAEYLYQVSRKVQCQLKPWLLNGRALCGIGNIYCSESLWLAALSPYQVVGKLNRTGATALAVAIQQVMSAAIEAGGTTLKDFRSAAGKPGYFQQELRAYGRKGQNCLRSGCTGHIEKQLQAQRATYYCPVCQT